MQSPEFDEVSHSTLMFVFLVSHWLVSWSVLSPKERERPTTRLVALAGRSDPFRFNDLQPKMTVFGRIGRLVGWSQTDQANLSDILGMFLSFFGQSVVTFWLNKSIFSELSNETMDLAFS